jgi:outer membrane protein assembly factor BamD
MNRSVTALACFLLALGLGGCGIFGDKPEPKKEWTAEQFYKAAKAEFDERNWEAAAKLYEQLETKFPYGRFAQQAQIEIAYAYYKQGDTVQAIVATDKFMKLHPNHPHVDYALYLKALSNFKEDLGPFARVVRQDLADRDPKAARESFEGFKELTTRFPALARHELNVARYYLARGAYLAAANRAQDAIKRFPNSPTHRQALDVMVESYDRMGMSELRDDTKKVLSKNFPADPMSGEGKNRTTSWWKFWQ